MRRGKLKRVIMSRLGSKQFSNECRKREKREKREKSENANLLHLEQTHKC